MNLKISLFSEADNQNKNLVKGKYYQRKQTTGCFQFPSFLLPQCFYPNMLLCSWKSAGLQQEIFTADIGHLWSSKNC